MLKLRANPLVFAAALGLLGPAALADDEEETEVRGPAGLWQRSATADGAAATLGDRIEVIQVDDAVIFDDGSGVLSYDQGTWTHGDEGALRQELVVGDAVVTRAFRVEGDALEITTVVSSGELTSEYSDRYQRLA